MRCTQQYDVSLHDVPQQPREACTSQTGCTWEALELLWTTASRQHESLRDPLESLTRRAEPKDNYTQHPNGRYTNSAWGLNDAGVLNTT